MIDIIRLKRLLTEITRNSRELKELIDENSLTPGSVPLKAAKYLLIELAEAMSNTIQHILAKEKGIAVSGYIDTIVKDHEHRIVSKELFEKLKPFFDFRNSLIHRYWDVDDALLIRNISDGQNDFDRFVEEIEAKWSKR
jgi:uncharacterized protein YutE (UPF0331/DUF86 family)